MYYCPRKEGVLIEVFKSCDPSGDFLKRGGCSRSGSQRQEWPQGLIDLV